MPPRSKIEQLPDDVRAQLDKKLIAGGFSGYVELAAWLSEHGHAIGKSAVGVYGQNLQRRLDAIKASTEAAKLIAQAAPDDAADLPAAIMSLVQTEIFEALLKLQEADDEADPAKRVDILGKAAKNIATVARASVARNKWAIEQREKVQAAAAAIKEIGSAAGISEETMAAIDRRIMGIV